MFKRLSNLNANTVTMWLNILGFVSGIIFYIRMDQSFQRAPTVAPHDPLRDTVLLIDTRLTSEIRELKAAQDSLVKEIRNNTSLLKQKQTAVRSTRRQLMMTLKSDFQSLSKEEQDAYIQQFISTLKNEKP